MSSVHQTIVIVGKVIDAIWEYNLVTVASNHIKVGNIILAIVMFLAGIRFSKRFTLGVKEYIKTKIDTDKDAANALEKLILYAALCLYVITILEIANIPLSTFAFIGGALAIGIGLGAQTLIGNFISSLIIMVERPMKIGDVVEIEGVVGTVSSVGGRCVILTTFSNVEVLVPNSKLMQNTLVNWSLSNAEVKYQLELTIQLNKKSEYKKIMDLIAKAIESLSFESATKKVEVFLTKITLENVTFSASFYCDISTIESQESIKGAANLALLEFLEEYDFSVSYPKIVDVSPINEQGEQPKIC